MDHRPSLLPPADADHYDDLSELERERHENDMRLKNTFEHIFEKYSRDFSAIGDEIDLETGEIVVDNGHIAHLRDERDTGEVLADWDDEDEEDAYARYEVGDSEDGDEDEDEDELQRSPPRHGRRRTSTIAQPPLASASVRRNRPVANTPMRPAATSQRIPQRMDLPNDPAFFQALGQSIAQGIAQYMSGHQGNSRPADPLWDAPPLPPPSHSSRRSAPESQRRRPMIPESPRHPSSRSLWATGRSVGRPRRRSRAAEAVADPSPSIRDNTSRPRIHDNNSRQRPMSPPPMEDVIRFEGYEETEDDQIQPEEQDDLDRDDIQDEEQDEATLDNTQFNRHENAHDDRIREDCSESAQGNVPNDVIQYEHEDSVDDEVVEYENEDEINAAAAYEDPMDSDYTPDPEDQDGPEDAEDLGDAEEPEDAEVTERARVLTPPDEGQEKVLRRTCATIRDRQMPVTPTTNATSAANGGSTAIASTDSLMGKSSGKSASQSRRVRKISRSDRWTKEEDELFIELKEVRNLSFPQIARFFPHRPPKNLENHWYKSIAIRRDKTRGEMSEYVRQALERGPILANKARMKPYMPKDPEKANPNRANLADPTRLLQDELQLIPDSESDGVSRSTSEDVTAPAAETSLSHGAPPFQEAPQTPPITPQSFEDRLRPTGDTKKPWACKKCGRAFAKKSGSRYHFSDPSRCQPLPVGRVSFCGRKNATPIPAKVAPPSLIPRGIDITTGRPASFNPNILFREDMERTYLCTLCGKSWASHSNAREHTRRPQQCTPQNWLMNYDPKAHRKRKVTDETAGNPASQAGPAPKRSKKNQSTNPRAVDDSEEGLRPGSPVHIQSHRTQPRLVPVPLREAEDSPHTESSPVRRGLPKRFTISDKTATPTRSENRIPIDPDLENMFDTPKVMEAVPQNMSLHEKMLRAEKPSSQMPQKSSIAQADGEPLGAGPNSAIRKRMSLASNRPTQELPVPGVNIGNDSSEPRHTKKASGQQSPSHLPEQFKQPSKKTAKADVTLAPACSTSNSNSNSKSTQSAPQHPNSTPSRLPVVEIQKRVLLPQPTPQTKAAVKSTSQAARSVPTKQQEQERHQATTPQWHRFSEASRSSPLNRTIISEPRATASIIDLLADDSGDELAF